MGRLGKGAGRPPEDPRRFAAFRRPAWQTSGRFLPQVCQRPSYPFPPRFAHPGTTSNRCGKTWEGFSGRPAGHPGTTSNRSGEGVGRPLADLTEAQRRFLCTPVFHSPSSTGLPKAFPGLPTARARRSGARIMVAQHGKTLGKAWEDLGKGYGKTFPWEGLPRGRSPFRRSAKASRVFPWVVGLVW